MVFTCPQRKVNDFEVKRKLRPGFGGEPREVDILVARPYGDPVDPFDSYYNRYRAPESSVQTPYHELANIPEDIDVAKEFLKRWGLPKPEDYRTWEIPIEDFFNEVKKLKSSILVWSAIKQGEWQLARVALPELIRSSYPYLGPRDSITIGFPTDDQNEESILRRLEGHVSTYSISLEGNNIEIRSDGQVYNPQNVPEDILKEACTGFLHSVFTDLFEFEKMKIFPNLNTNRDPLNYHLGWELRPVRFLGVEDLGPADLVHEELHFSAPYFVMLLLDVTEGRENRTCKNANCRRVFPVERPNRLYCSRSCANAQVNRDYRSRIRKRMET